ncbi:GTPase domain-containing protein [Paludisphaera soli]|uniref:GTPase domain-containing protein n=1 Tax=Paludisphaera soli TaxID=2712865 RepID=UPI0013EA760E|nr:GTPase domain-containing protein [Paludisphaera soli]
MSNRNARLDALEARLTGPKRIALFGHRNVGKTTLLAMFYRQAAGGLVPGVRLAAADAPTAEYLAEKIAQIESGDPTSGTLSETELHLRLYHGPARFELIVKDYQGEHVTLGTDEPIQEFFAGCDAVFLCLDPEGSTDVAERRRRQQEVENLLERYIERSEDISTDRPVALLLTKFDRVLDREGRGSTADEAFVEALVDRQYGMTRHALRQHAPDGVIFAVSSFGSGSDGNRPPSEIRPMGLEGPLGWVAEQLETRDRAQMELLWDLAPKDLPRLRRCLAAYEKRYPRSNRTYEFRERLKRRERGRKLARFGKLAGAAAILAGLAVGYDYWGYTRASAFERDSGNAATAVARSWSDLLEAHPTLPYFLPRLAREAANKRAEWTVKATGVQIAAGTVVPDLDARLEAARTQAPELAPAIREVEKSREQVRHDERWKDVYAQVNSLETVDEPDKGVAALDGFLREFPDTTRRPEILKLAQGLKAELTTRRTAAERRTVDDLVRSEALPNASLADLIERSRKFLDEHPESPYRTEVQDRLDEYVRRLDDRDIARAREYSQRQPTSFAARIEKYQEYLKAHQAGGRYISEAIEARDKILREWDAYSYRQAYDHAASHPDDVAEVARRLRDYLRDHPDGRFAETSKTYLDWWDKASTPHGYRVTLRRGEVASSTGKYLAGGGPDLGVTIQVGGVTYGPSPVIANSTRPIWDYTFPQPVVWKYGDPVTIRVVDYDWSASEIAVLNSRQGDPLAMRLLDNTIKFARGGQTSLTFASDFAMPALARPR